MSQLRYNKQLVASLTLGLTLLFAIFSTTSSSPPSYLYAQQQQLKQSNSTSTAIAGVKITSPTKGQQVPVDRDLTISGISTDNSKTSDCKVSVIVNGNNRIVKLTLLGKQVGMTIQNGISP